MEFTNLREHELSHLSWKLSLTKPTRRDEVRLKDATLCLPPFSSFSWPCPYLFCSFFPLGVKRRAMLVVHWGTAIIREHNLKLFVVVSSYIDVESPF